MTVVNNATAISTTVVGGVTYVNINGTKTQVIKGQVSFPAAPTATAAGVAGTAIITLTGTFVAGDQVRVTVSLPNSGQRLVKSYVHTVVAGGTSLASIAAALAALITADINAGLPGIATAISALGVLTLTQASTRQPVIGGTTPVNVVAYADSAAGVATVTGTATTVSQGTPADLIAEGVDPSNIGLASYSTVLLKAKIDGAFPFIDSDGKTVKEIKFYSTNAICLALIAAL
jgi:hypothetical protein